MQRIFDILFAGLALLILVFPFLIIMLILRLTGEGEIFYIQQRIGKDGIPFGVFKFATMRKNSSKIGTGTVTVKNDPRVLPIGRFLRKAKINELPQLVNVLAGSMSVIGPRPQTQRCFDAFPKELQTVISSVRPGLSGVGSVAFRDEEAMMHEAENANKFYDYEIMPYKGALEVWYARNRNLGTYFGLIGLTVWVVFTGNTSALYSLYKSLPHPPNTLRKFIRV